MAMSRLGALFVSLLFVVSYVSCDTPANCTYESISGTWTFSIGKGGGDNTINCSKEWEPETKYTVTLYFPDMAVDELGNVGRWTMIYNQGFEVQINGYKFFAFSLYKQNGETVTSLCSQTFPGWVHNDFETDWACYRGQKQGENIKLRGKPSEPLYDMNRKYIVNEDFINEINQHQKSWRSTVYKHYNEFKVQDMIRRAGGRKSARTFPRTASATQEVQNIADKLPESIDWRNRDGVNFVSPVRNQESCGSCYAFGSMALHEARLRIATNNTVQKVFSTQDIVSCSEYSQGCDGGFPYLIAGKYAQDFGLIEDSCFPYTAKDDQCISTKCERYYAKDYYYIGGYYGACNEALMRIELVKNGPIAISFEVYPDFQHYKSGIYHHTGLTDPFNPWEITNHVVLIVGYGAEPETGEKYWIVKNSWGEEWGEDGFFRIRRGVDECSIESMAVGTFPEL